MFLFRLKRTFKLGFKSLWMHRLRSTLTMLGSFSVFHPVVAMLAIGEGASRDAQEKISQLGSRNIIIRTVPPPEDKSSVGQQQTLKEYGLTYADAERFRGAIPTYVCSFPTAVSPSRPCTATAAFPSRLSERFPGTAEISSLETIYGRFINSIDIHYKRAVCVIDEFVRKELLLLMIP